MRSIITVAAFAFAMLGSTTPTEAHCTLRHPGHCVKAAVETVAEVVAPIPLVGQTTEKILKEATNAPGSITDKFENGAQSLGRKTGLDDVDDLGAKLGALATVVAAAAVGTACTTATLGACAPIVLAGVGGSVVGSAIEGESSGYVGASISTGGDTPAGSESSPGGRQPTSEAIAKAIGDLLPEVSKWLALHNGPAEMAKFNRDYVALSAQVPYGESRLAWVITEGSTYRGMTLNPDGFWIGSNREQHKIFVEGTKGATLNSDGLLIPPSAAAQ
ncbi:MAG: hypothetical protein OXF93_10070 [Acidobacteria bacterium]|nr:hypothetical protein [Acidobacteriota bacterium]